MVPAESMENLDCKPLSPTMLLNTPSAAGLRQILPAKNKKQKQNRAKQTTLKPEA